MIPTGNQPQTLDHLVFELGNAIVSLRDELEFQQRTVAGEINYVIEDTATGSFYRIGFPEYSFLTLLDGKRTVDDAIAICATALRGETISIQRAESLCSWLIESELATTQYSTNSSRMEQRRRKIDNQKWIQRVNPIMMKFSIGCPDPQIGMLYRATRWFFNVPMLILGCLLIVAAILQVCQDWSRFTGGGNDVLAAGNWIWLGVTWVMIKLIHELGHGLMAKKFGGEVRDCGLLLLLLIPMPFVDVTSSWRFPKARQRILTSAAGMMLELSVAAVAVFVWSYTASGFVNQAAYNIILTASVTTILFNANPLMRFDGYYMLVDALDIPNLGTKGQQWIHARARWLFFGLAMPDSKTNWRTVVTKLYGIAALGWRMLIVVTLTLAAYTLFSGIGLLIAAGSLLLTIAVPGFRIAKFFFCGSETQKPGRLQFVSVVGCLACLTVAVLIYVPGPSTLKADGVVQYDPLMVVRAKSKGFVSQLHVRPGQQVQAGQLLVTLIDKETSIDRDNALIEVELSKMRLRQLQQNSQYAAYQAEQEQLRANQVRLKQLNKSTADLKVHSPTSGIVVTPSLEEITGRFFDRGDEIMSVGDTDKKKVVGLVSPFLSKQLQRFRGQQVQTLVFGSWQQTINGTLRTVGVRASKDAVHDALTATAGGSLTVQQIDPGKQAGNERSEARWELVEPHVRIEVDLDQHASSHLFAGQGVQVRIQTDEETLFDYLNRRVTKWVHSQIKTNHGI